MNALDQFGHLLEVDLDDMISRAEDPEKRLDDFLLELAEPITSLREQLKALGEVTQQLKKRISDEERLATESLEKATLAADDENKALVNEALTAMGAHWDVAHTLNQEWAAQTRVARNLRKDMKRFENKRDLVQVKKHELLAGRRVNPPPHAIMESLARLDSVTGSYFARMQEESENDSDDI